MLYYEETMQKPINSLPLFVRNEVEKVLDEFDAFKVAKVMEFMDWKWATLGPEGMTVPPATEIKQTARYLMAESYFSAMRKENEGRGQVSTGGLVARCTLVPRTEDDIMPRADFDITFAAESAHSWPE
jgi:hypothetical protein